MSLEGKLEIKNLGRLIPEKTLIIRKTKLKQRLIWGLITKMNGVCLRRGEWIFHTNFLLKVCVHYYIHMFRMVHVLSLLGPKRYRITQI